MNQAIPWSDALAAYGRRAHAPACALDVDEGELLARYHPDEQEAGHVLLRVGPNRGTRCARELAELLHARPLVDDADLAAAPSLECDVLVIGAGGAGCIAALSAAAAGARVMLATKLALGDGNTVMAEGGMQAAVAPEDSLQRHFDDTWRAGRFAGVPALVATLVREGPDALRWLIQHGMSFDLARGEAPFATLRRKVAGGTTFPRIHSFRDLTGLEMMRVLREAVALEPRISSRAHVPAIELLSEGYGSRRCRGAVLYDSREQRFVMVRAGAVVLATGGAGRLHMQGFPTSNHLGATADGLVLAYRIGARLTDIDSHQYHPTGLAWPSRLHGQLVSEAARSAGARLLNGRGERFVNELSARDIVSAAILRECHESRGVERDGQRGVLLDLPGLLRESPEILANDLVALSHLAERAAIDPHAEPLLVQPTLHYQNGGVRIDCDGASDVCGLYCAGEVAGGIHGRNRLMGNALLELVVFGRRAGTAAARCARSTGARSGGVGHLRGFQRELAQACVTICAAPKLFPDSANWQLVVERGSAGAVRNI